MERIIVFFVFIAATIFVHAAPPAGQPMIGGARETESIETRAAQVQREGAVFQEQEMQKPELKQKRVLLTTEKKEESIQKPVELSAIYTRWGSVTTKANNNIALFNDLAARDTKQMSNSFKLVVDTYKDIPEQNQRLSYINYRVAYIQNIELAEENISKQKTFALRSEMNRLMEEGVQLERRINQFNTIIDSQRRNIQKFIDTHASVTDQGEAPKYMEASSISKLKKQQELRWEKELLQQQEPPEDIVREKQSIGAKELRDFAQLLEVKKSDTPAQKQKQLMSLKYVARNILFRLKERVEEVGLDSRPIDAEIARFNISTYIPQSIADVVDNASIAPLKDLDNAIVSDEDNFGKVKGYPEDYLKRDSLTLEVRDFDDHSYQYVLNSISQLELGLKVPTRDHFSGQQLKQLVDAIPAE
ncbi:MAG: hypothetical protein WCE21_00555 [Candidatus Babeliales bacterium]